MGVKKRNAEPEIPHFYRTKIDEGRDGMSQTQDKRAIKAKKMYQSGMSLADIAKKMRVPNGTVRSWKNRYDWDGKRVADSATQNVEKNVEKNATRPKRKRGAQPGNQNAKWGPGNPHPTVKNPALKHGGYSAVNWDTLYDDEKELYDSIPDDEELLLVEEIRISIIRERRLIKAINKYIDANGDMVITESTRTETKREFENKEEEEEFRRIRQRRIDNGDVLPGRAYQEEVKSENKDMIRARLEQELSTVQNRKTKAIEALSKIRIEREKIEGDFVSEEVDDWIAACLEDEPNGK